MNIKTHIPLIPDWPTAGVNFLDITGVLTDAECFNFLITWMVNCCVETQATSVVAVESRGFVFAAPVAAAANLPLILARKKGKLPPPVHTISYTTEYSSDQLNLQQSARPGSRPVIIDDVLATGGTICAVADLLRQNWACDSITAVLPVSLEFLNGRMACEQKNIKVYYNAEYR